jgi:hypothetical protein
MLKKLIEDEIINKILEDDNFINDYLNIDKNIKKTLKEIDIDYIKKYLFSIKFNIDIRCSIIEEAENE